MFALLCKSPCIHTSHFHMLYLLIMPAPVRWDPQIPWGFGGKMLLAAKRGCVVCVGIEFGNVEFGGRIWWMGMDGDGWRWMPFIWVSLWIPSRNVCACCKCKWLLPIHVLATSGHHGSSGPGTDVPNSFTVDSPVFAACFVSMAAIRCAVFRSSSWSHVASLFCSRRS